MATVVRRAEIYQPNRFFNRKELGEAAEIIEKQADQGLMLPHRIKELKGAARRGELMLLRDDSGKVKGVVEISAKHRTRRISGKLEIGRVKAAELGALAIDPEYQGNGYGRDLVRSLAEHYLRESFLRKILQHPDILLFAMAGVNNAGSNRTFQSLNGISIDQSLLPERARGEGYNTYDITHLGRRRV